MTDSQRSPSARRHAQRAHRARFQGERIAELEAAIRAHRDAYRTHLRTGVDFAGSKDHALWALIEEG